MDCRPARSCRDAGLGTSDPTTAQAMEMTMMTRNDMLETFDHSPHALRMTPAIVVGVDADSASRQALRWAADQSRLTGLPLRVVHAWQLNSVGAAFAGVTGYAEAFAVDARAQATCWVLDALSDDAEMRWTLEIVEGAAGAVLVTRSRSAQLLVLGTGDHTGLRRFVRGSVSHYCLAHAVPPVVAVPAAEGDLSTTARRSAVLATPGPLL